MYVVRVGAATRVWLCPGGRAREPTQTRSARSARATPPRRPAVDGGPPRGVLTQDTMSAVCRRVRRVCLACVTGDSASRTTLDRVCTPREVEDGASAHARAADRTSRSRIRSPHGRAPFLAQEHHIVDEAGRNQLQVTMEQFAEASRVRAKSEEETRRREHRLAEQVDGLRLQVLQLQALIESQNDEKAPGRRTPPPQCARRRLA